MNNIENLWGEIVSKQEDATHPKTILKQQAKILSDITKNYLVGEVYTTTPNDLTLTLPSSTTHYPSDLQMRLNNAKKYKKYALKYEFLIKAPSLGYQFVLLSFVYDLKQGFPITITNELDEKTLKVNDENDFKETLKQIFTSDSTMRVLSNLLSHNDNKKSNSEGRRQHPLGVM